MRGLAILVRNRYQSEPIGRVSLFWLFVKVSGGDLEHTIIIGTVYVPVWLECAHIFQLLSGTMKKIQEEHPDVPVVLTGDFNMELH